MVEAKPVRCAIYTRKSSEEGLEQAFNSLDAQREACAAYVVSQKHEGWTLLPTVYDDGGFSGGNMARPGLTALMAAVDAGDVDVIVVYKVDRLTRSLADFARIVDVLDRRGASFVSITQAFNTTSSMGRLTLNVLLSFAQFEREVTGERIRDKIAASKAKGMWMGGNVPLGYRVADRKLQIVEQEAEQVRTLFRLYLKHRSVDTVADRAFAAGIRSKTGTRIARSSLYRILANPAYAGQVAHRGQLHEGEHDAIVDQKTWKAVQALTERQRRKAKGAGTAATANAVFGGRVVDHLGQRLVATHTLSRGRRYDYYASVDTSPGTPALRVPAAALDTIVIDHLAERLGSPEQVAVDHMDATDDLPGLIQATAVLAAQLRHDAHAREAAADLVDQVMLAPERVTIRLKDGSIVKNLGSITYDVATTIGRAKGGLKLVVGGASERAVDPALLRLVAQARSWFEILSSGAGSIQSIAKENDLAPSTVSQILPLAFLSPDIVTAIAEGRQPAGLTATTLRISPPPRPLWHAERITSSRAQTDTWHPNR